MVERFLVCPFVDNGAAMSIPGATAVERPEAPLA